MDPNFQELAREISDSVDARLRAAFVDSEARLRAALVDAEARIEQRVERRIERRVERRVERRLDARFEERLNQFEERTEKRMQMHFENLEGTIRLAAEGYAAGLDRLDRQVAEMNAQFRAQFADHALVLGDHEKRIGKLEGSP